MKKRKVKLFASVASLAMVAAVMGVGVWAATAHSVEITSTVGFTGSGIAGSVALQITAEEGNKQDILNTALATGADEFDLASKQTLVTFTYDQTTQAPEYSVTLDLEDASQDGYINAGATITYTFEITAAAESKQNMQYVVTATGHDAYNESTNSDGIFNEAVTITTTKIDGKDPASATQGQAVLAAGSTAVVTVVYTVHADQPSITGADLLGTINIALTATATAATPTVQA